MVALAIVLLIISVSLGAAGQLCLKYGVSLLGNDLGPLGVIKGIFTPYVFMGFAFYLLSSLLYLWVLSKLSLSFAYPFVALSFVLVVFASWWLLGESVPPLRIVGVGLIMIGVLTVAASYQRAMPADNAPPAIEQPR